MVALFGKCIVAVGLLVLGCGFVRSWICSNSFIFVCLTLHRINPGNAFRLVLSVLSMWPMASMIW